MHTNSALALDGRYHCLLQSAHKHADDINTGLNTIRIRHVVVCHNYNPGAITELQKKRSSAI